MGAATVPHQILASTPDGEAHLDLPGAFSHDRGTGVTTLHGTPDGAVLELHGLATIRVFMDRLTTFRGDCFEMWSRTPGRPEVRIAVVGQDHIDRLRDFLETVLGLTPA